MTATWGVLERKLAKTCTNAEFWAKISQNIWFRQFCSKKLQTRLARIQHVSGTCRARVGHVSGMCRDVSGTCRARVGMCRARVGHVSGCVGDMLWQIVTHFVVKNLEKHESDAENGTFCPFDQFRSQNAIFLLKPPIFVRIERVGMCRANCWDRYVQNNLNIIVPTPRITKREKKQTPHVRLRWHTISHLCRSSKKNMAGRKRTKKLRELCCRMGGWSACKGDAWGKKNNIGVTSVDVLAALSSCVCESSCSCSRSLVVWVTGVGLKTQCFWICFVQHSLFWSYLLSLFVLIYAFYNCTTTVHQPATQQANWGDSHPSEHKQLRGHKTL